MKRHLSLILGMALSLPAAAQQGNAGWIANPGHVYVFRLATALSPEVLRTDFRYDGTNKEAVRQKIYTWWDNLEQKLNEFYQPNVGIRFQVVKDDKLILFDNTTGLDLSVGSPSLISTLPGAFAKLIGQDSYEIAVMTVPSHAKSGGLASLGSAFSAETRGVCWAGADYTVIAHEVGHTLGAYHTYSDIGNIAAGWSQSNTTEPGLGESLMSYGRELPRDFLSLRTIEEIRANLATCNYYTDSSRKEKVSVSAKNTTLPYVEAAEGSLPQIDDTRLYGENTIPQGTCFQFTVPVTTPTNDQMRYAVHPYDVGSYNLRNPLQPAYKATASNNIMFQPYMLDPGNDKNNLKVAYLTGSDKFDPGQYTFLAAAMDHHSIGTKKIKRHIVEGERFDIPGGKIITTNLIRPGESYTLTWTPARQVFGNDARVRVLLSTDFGQTYSYILADDLPNNGSCTVTMPYIDMPSQVTYRDLINVKEAGGRIKIEVKGEAAYAVWPKEDYVIQNEAVGKGFPMTIAGARAQFDDAPEPFVSVANVEEAEQYNTTHNVPQALTSKRNSSSTQAKLKTTRLGNTIRNEWAATFSGYTYTYVQVISWPETLTGSDLARAQLRDFGREAIDVHKNVGQLGYPRTGTAKWTAFETAYNKVYFSDGTTQAGVSPEDVSELKSALAALKSQPAAIVLPAGGAKYKVRVYANVYCLAHYYYVSSDQSFTENEGSAAEWTCTAEAGGKFSFAANGLTLFSGQGGKSFADNDKAFSLYPGYSWGAFSIVNSNSKVARYNVAYSDFYPTDFNADRPAESRLNFSDGSQASTDFQLVGPAGPGTSIREVNGTTTGAASPYYTPEGKTMGNRKPNQPGLYIRDGKKIIVK